MTTTITGSGGVSQVQDGSIGTADFAANAITAAKLPTGSVLQVISYYTAAQTAQTLSSTDAVINSMSKVVTPLGANSKFLVVLRWGGEVTGTQDTTFNIQMDGTRVNSGGGQGYYLGFPCVSYSGSNANSTPETINFSTLVSTSSSIGTDITFRVVGNTNTSTTMWSNRCFGSVPTGGTEGTTSELIITEIAG
jgi:hypothetical protein